MRRVKRKITEEEASWDSGDSIEEVPIKPRDRQQVLEELSQISKARQESKIEPFKLV